MKPIDDMTEVPPPKGMDANYLTQDIESALRREVLALVDRIAAQRRIGRRRAAMIVLSSLRGAT
jgi:hypothetical protein